MMINLFRNIIHVAAFVLVLSASSAIEAASTILTGPDAVNQTQVRKAYGKLPLSFEANQGQSDPQVKFLSHGSGYTMFLTSTEMVLTLKQNTNSEIHNAGNTLQNPKSTVLHIQLVGSNPAPQIEGLNELSGKSNYFVGSDPKKWHSLVSQYARVKYQRVYPGIDLVFYGNQQQLEYDFLVAPGADPKDIRLGFKGMDKLSLDDDGNLILHIANSEVIQRAPVIYQEINGVKQVIPGRYVLQGKDQVGFQLAAYDTDKPLVIDPVLFYSTYLGGNLSDTGIGIAVDASGNAYVTGRTQSTNFPIANSLQPTLGGGFDAFVAKLSPTGSALIYVTYLGGILEDQGQHIFVDASGNAYITGRTNSPDFPIVNPLQSTLGGGFDAFVAKLNPTGSALVYSTYLGGSGDENVRSEGDIVGDIAVDSLGNAYVTGWTQSIDFPTANPLQPTLGGSFDAFVAKLNSTGSALDYSTYLGGTLDDRGYGIAVDTSNNAYVTGETESANFPTANPLQPAFGGIKDAFVTKLNSTGSALVYSTYLGGSVDDIGFDIAVDIFDNAYVTGKTESPDFPTANPLQPAIGGTKDAFVSKLDPTGSALDYSTYLGGIGNEEGLGIAVDTSGNAYVTGLTTSPDFPTVGPLQPAFGGISDPFVTKLNAAGSAFHYSTYLGGNGGGAGRDIAVDTHGNAYVTGVTASTDFPTANPLQPSIGGFIDAFVAKISTGIEIIVSLEENGGQNLVTVTLSNGGTTTEEAELKLWIESASLSILASIVGVPTPVLTLPPTPPFEFMSNTPLPGVLPFPGTKVGGRLLNPITRDTLSESICTEVPCN